MIKVDKKPAQADIYDLYNFYGTYKQYFEYYWTHINQKNITKDDIEDRMSEILTEGRKLGGPIEALCFYANIPVSELFNKDGTPKDINELDTLKMIREANYGETND